MKIGIDAHKRTHTLAADQVGRQLASKTVPATTDGHLAAPEWGAQWPERSWAVEDIVGHRLPDAGLCHLTPIAH